MATTRLTTIQIVSQIKAELEQMLEDESGLAAGLSEPSEAAIRLDVVQTDTRACILVEVPGLEAEDLEVTVSGNLVTVSGNRKAARAPAPGSRFLCVERQWGRFQRQIELPSTIDPSQGRASLANGILRVDFPLLPDQRNKTYRLEVEPAGEGDA